MANAVAVNDSPLKGSPPVPANTIVTAHDHMSAAAVTRSAASCSGAMNAGVPMATWPEGPIVVIPGTAASPKSISTGPSGPSRTLPGLKSRCTIPAACTAPSAISVATAMRSRAAPPRGPNCSTTSTSDGPLTYSLTLNGRRSKIPASRTCAVQNRATRCAAATSFRKRLRTCGSVVGGRSLTATRLPAGLSARNTTPCPPSPRRPSNRYTPTSRGSVSRRGSILDIVNRADVTWPFCPAGSARATFPFRQMPTVVYPAAAYAFEELKQKTLTSACAVDPGASTRSGSTAPRDHSTGLASLVGAQNAQTRNAADEAADDVHDVAAAVLAGAAARALLPGRTGLGGLADRPLAVAHIPRDNRTMLAIQTPRTPRSWAPPGTRCAPGSPSKPPTQARASAQASASAAGRSARA